MNFSENDWIMLVYNFVYYIMILFINTVSIFFKLVRGWHCREFVVKLILSNHIAYILTYYLFCFKINHMNYIFICYLVVKFYKSLSFPIHDSKLIRNTPHKHPSSLLFRNDMSCVVLGCKSNYKSEAEYPFAFHFPKNRLE